MCSCVEYFNFENFVLFRKKYNDNENKVVFLAVSDDNKWIKVLKYYSFFSNNVMRY